MPQVNTVPVPGRFTTGVVGESPTMTGNRILIQMQGKTIGRVQNMTVRETSGTEALYELGSMLPAELVPMRWSGSLSVDKYRLSKKAFEGLPVAYGENILKKTLFDVVVVDKSDGSILEKYAGCVQADMSSGFPANRPSTQNVTFYFMDHVEGDAVGGNQPANQ